MELYSSFAWTRGIRCVGYVGAGELILVGVGEAIVKYHSADGLRLTLRRYPASRQGMVGSLTGAVASQKVTEAPKGSLRLGGHQPQECNGTRELDCEADTPSRDESRA
jgi:hypothetical protein